MSLTSRLASQAIGKRKERVVRIETKMKHSRLEVLEEEVRLLKLQMESLKGVSLVHPDPSETVPVIGRNRIEDPD